MNNSTEILNELKSVSPLLAEMEKNNVYSIPKNYFSNLESKIARFAMASSTKDVSIEDGRHQQVPEGYFESLSTNILAKVRDLYPESASEELQKISPELYALKDVNVFSVPEDYFNSIANDIRVMIKSPGAKVVEMKSSGTWWKVAAAAVVAGVLAISSLQLFQHSSRDGSSGSVVVMASANLPDYIKESLQFKTAEDLNAGIAKLSDEDIIRYLETNGNILDNALLLKDADVTELPEQADYLLDEHALNTYLSKIAKETTVD